MVRSLVCQLCICPDYMKCCHQENGVGYACTRERGHSGKHAGCGTQEEDHPIMEWDNEQG